MALDVFHIAFFAWGALIALFENHDFREASSTSTLDEKSARATIPEPNVTDVSKSSETEEQASSSLLIDKEQVIYCSCSQEQASIAEESAKKSSIYSTMKDGFNRYFNRHKVEESFDNSMLFLTTIDNFLLKNEYVCHEKHEMENAALAKIFGEQGNEDEGRRAKLDKTKVVKRQCDASDLRFNDSPSLENFSDSSARRGSSDSVELEFVMVSLSDVEDLADQ